MATCVLRFTKYIVASVLLACQKAQINREDQIQIVYMAGVLICVPSVCHSEQ